jgi:hypothetical protein
MSRISSPSRRGSASGGLGGGAEFKASEATLYVSGLFQFSKVAPIRSVVTGVQERLRAVEKELATLKCGKELPYGSV